MIPAYNFSGFVYHLFLELALYSRSVFIKADEVFGVNADLSCYSSTQSET